MKSKAKIQKVEVFHTYDEYRSRYFPNIKTEQKLEKDPSLFGRSLVKESLSGFRQS